MRKSKSDIRKELEAGLTIFLSEGKQVTKVDVVMPRKRYPQEEDEPVEIEYECLPMVLQKKYFGVE